MLTRRAIRHATTVSVIRGRKSPCCSKLPTGSTATLVHTPVHASWLNQCEIYFSVVQRKVVTPNDFSDLAEVRNRLAAFQEHYNLAARPFNWTYTTNDLNDLLDRLAAHDAAPLATAA